MNFADCFLYALCKESIFFVKEEPRMNSKLIMRQNGQVYYIYTPQGILIAQLFMGQDGQYARDVQCLTAVGRAMAKRWDIPTGKN